ncbi:MAG: hypothetical protein MK289_12930 [Trichodesmium sp. ALOHA_ZT_67]|nr:hypothetical protein [Trichodesmium sp. ALOHA_ZT_67]MDT9338285.1 hypothetical protein [Trichodesmium erythraeum 21-75]
MTESCFLGWVFPTIIKLFTLPFKARGHCSRGRLFHRRAIAKRTGSLSLQRKIIVDQAL